MRAVDVVIGNPVFQRLVASDARQYSDEYAQTVTAMKHALENTDVMQLLRGLKSRPELAKVEETKLLLAECGIEMEFELKDGKEVPVIRFRGVSV